MPQSPVDAPISPPNRVGPIVKVMGQKPNLKRIMEKQAKKKRLVPR